MNATLDRKPHKHQAIADRWTGEECTLDGSPARVSGRMLEYGYITSDKKSVEFAWPTIHRIMTDTASKRGQFKS